VSTRVVKLRNPIQVGSQTITELEFRPLCAKDLRKLPADSGLDMALALAARLSGHNDVVIDKLTGDDLTEVVGLVADFMPGGRTTGDERSQS
jgi:hypothetical protein